MCINIYTSFLQFSQIMRNGFSFDLINYKIVAFFTIWIHIQIGRFLWTASKYPYYFIICTADYDVSQTPWMRNEKWGTLTITAATSTQVLYSFFHFIFYLNRSKYTKEWKIVRSLNWQISFLYRSFFLLFGLSTRTRHLMNSPFNVRSNLVTLLWFTDDHHWIIFPSRELSGPNMSYYPFYSMFGMR